MITERVITFPTEPTEGEIEGLMTEFQVFIVWYGIESGFW